MIIKQIALRAVPGGRERLLHGQRRWNEVMERQPGFLWSYVACDAADDDRILIVIAFAAASDLDRFMATAHDPLELETRLSRFYVDIHVEVYEVHEPQPNGLAHIVPEARSSPANAVIGLAQAYRWSAVLRHAVQARLFDIIADTPGTADELASRLGVDTQHLERILAVLDGLKLIDLGSDHAIRNRPIAHEYLRWNAPASLCALVLHDARHDLFLRWSEGGIGVTDPFIGPTSRFADAVSAIANAGQAIALVDALDRAGIDLSGCTLLDIGGSMGEYSKAIAARWDGCVPSILEQASVVELANAAGTEVSFIAGDYRTSLPKASYDAVLLSNIIRGETPEDAAALLDRVRQVLAPGGLLILHDLLTVDESGAVPLGAALFGVHLPDAIRPSVRVVGDLLVTAGFEAPRIEPIEAFVSSNVVLIARVAATGR
ncbi:MAG: methyltransferase [Acidimicrobiales bacterium]